MRRNPLTLLRNPARAASRFGVQFEEKGERKRGNDKGDGQDAKRGGTNIDRADRRLDKFWIRDAPTYDFSPDARSPDSRSNSVAG